ncbi:MAG: polysaccharide biosynthesis tyrosine autokinase [Pyrinomonadaceae bacterium]
MMSPDDRLLPLSGVERGLERPLREPVQAKPYGISPTEPTHLRDYMQVVLKRKWLILTLALVVTTLVTIYMYRQPNIYEAATTIQIEDKQSSILQTDKIVIDTGKTRDPAYWNTQLKLLVNPTLLRQVILTLDLQNNPSFWGTQNRTGLISTLRGVFSREKAADATAQPTPAGETALPVVSDTQPTGTGAPSTSEGGTTAPVIVSETQVKEQQLSAEDIARLEPYEDMLAANLKVDPVPGTDLVTMRFTHSSPELAQKVVNTLADVFVTNNLARMTAGSDKSADLLANQIAQLQLKIKQREEARLNYATANNLPLDDTPGPGGGGGTNLSTARLSSLSQQLLDAENVRKNLQATYEGASRAKDPYTVPAIQEDKRVQDLRKQLEDLKQKRAELLVTYTAEWPDVKKIDEQIKPVEAALAKAPSEVIAGMKARYEDALSKETLLRQSFNQQAGENAQQNQAMIQMNVIKQELATDQQYYNTLLQRQRELQITNNDRPNNVTVATYSRVPRAPIGPQRMRNVMIALLLSLGAGIGLAFLLDYLDDTVKTVDDVDRYIHVPALALIPAMRSERARLKGKTPAMQPDSAATALAVISDVRSPIAEAYRHLRTSLLLSSAGQPPKTILVTSSQPSEGKTTTAANIATTLAQTGAEVLIVDCDLRRPRIHVHFNVQNVQGVTNYLSGESDLDALFQSFDKLPNLKVLPSGPVPPNPAELLGSDEMRKLLNVLGERFTHIIIDSPPAISFTDASILSTMVDGVMLVVHGGRSSRAVVRRAKQQLIDVGANIFGIVLNNVKAESTDYYYGGYYSHYYSDDGDDGPEEGVGANAGAR